MCNVCVIYTMTDLFWQYTTCVPIKYNNPCREAIITDSDLITLTSEC